MQRIRGLIAATVVGVPLAIYLGIILHATREFAILVGCCVGFAIFAVVSTRSDSRDEAADAAWNEAARDLPPASDRTALERRQAAMSGPEKRRGSVLAGAHRPQDDRDS